MAKRDRESLAADPVPLRTLAQQADTDPADRLLAEGLAALYEDASTANSASAQATSVAGWERLQAQAQSLAQRRRRRYLLRELVATWIARPLPLLAACGLLVLILAPSDHPVPAPVVTPARIPSAVLVENSHAEFSSVAQTVRLRAGAELQADHATVAIEQADRLQTRIALSAGSIRLQVPPLPGRGKLVVATSDAEVIVHGTRFTVRKVDAASTAVSVDEGLVEVRPQGGDRMPVFLRPGESITVPSLTRYKEEVETHAATLIEAGRCEDPDHSVARYLSLAPAGADVSAAQYLQGFCAAQRKESDEAIRWFERAAANSHDQVRADNALARAAKLRADRSESDGKVAWRRYLDRFPQGLHRESAARSLTGPH